jgi:glycosyltransferase involved in cell wall biosynthesis
MAGARARTVQIKITQSKKTWSTMKPLNILLPVHVFFPDHFYGTETYTLELAQCLKRMGHNPTILTSILYGEKSPGGDRFTYEYGGLTVDCTDLNTQPLKKFKQLYSRPDLYPVIADIIQQRQPDIIHVTHLMGHTPVLLEVIRDMKIPVVATLTDFYGICPNSKLIAFDGSPCTGPNRRSTNCLSCYIREHDYEFSSSKTLAPLIRKDNKLPWVSFLLPYAAELARFSHLRESIWDAIDRTEHVRKLYDIYACMITPTDLLHDAYVRNRFYPKKLHKINFGINLDMVKAYRHTMTEAPVSIRFGYIGQITSHKGVDLLMKAFADLTGPPATLSIYGPRDQDAAYMAELDRLSDGRGAVVFKDTFPKDQLGQVLSEIDVLVIPSRWYENSPLVLLYALATKTPVIVTDMKGMSEFVKNGYNGFTFKKDDASQLGLIMQQIVDNPATLLQLSKNADYNKGIMDHAENVLDIYLAVLRNTENG